MVVPPGTKRRYCSAFSPQESSFYIKVSKVDDQKAPFSILKRATPFPGLLHFTLNTYLILLSVKQRSINYHF